MRLSIAVIAMSNLPSIMFVSWNSELGVGVIFTSMPCRAKNPFSRATQIGQLKPPGKTMRLTVWTGAGRGATAVVPLGETAARGGPGGSPAHEASATINIGNTKYFRRCMSPPLRSARSRHGLQRRLLVLLVCAKLGDVGPRAPHAERLGRERELPRPVARLFLGQDVLYPDRVLV